MDQVARKPVVKQGRARLPLPWFGSHLNVEITNGLLLEIPCLALVSYNLRTLSCQGVRRRRCGHPSVTRTECLLAPIYQAAGHQRWVWPGGGVWSVETLVWWWGEEEMVQHHPDRFVLETFPMDLYHYWLIMKVTFVKSVLLFRWWSICVWLRVWRGQRTRTELFVNSAVNTE